VIELDGQALLRGVVVAAVITVPAALIGLWASDSDELGWLATLCVVVVLAGLVLGGVVAAHQQQVGAPLTHGILAAAVLFVVVQGIGLVRRALGSDDIEWSRVLSSLVLALIAGAIGGVIGGRLHRPIGRAGRAGGPS
jgi:putative membrane protein (TIGR04086 family)